MGNYKFVAERHEMDYNGYDMKTRTIKGSANSKNEVIEKIKRIASKEEQNDRVKIFYDIEITIEFPNFPSYKILERVKVNY